MILALLGVLVFQQIYYLRHIQKLINKVMSRDYREYRFAETLEPRNTVKKAAPALDPGMDTSAVVSSIF